MSGVKETIFGLFQVTGLPELVRKISARNSRFVLVMHGVAKDFYPDIGPDLQPHHSVATFRQVVNWIINRYSILTAADFLITEKPGVLLTFDDGFANNVKALLPVLEEFSVPAVFFISLQHVLDVKNWLPASRAIARRGWGSESLVPDNIAEDFFDGMTIDQLKYCSAHPLIELGSHTISHPFLSRCSHQELEYEITKSKRILENLTGKKIDMIAYPTGDYDRRTVDMVRSAGYRAAFAVDPLHISDFRWEIPRIGIYQADDAYLSLKLSGLHRRPLSPQAISRA